jgi:UDP-4-amino-4,6-dideoxy-N-acetyl-beta-L-altrosamine N-acetyltransferase
MQPLWLVRGRTVTLRRMTAEDAEMIVQWRNQPEARSWLIQWKPLTVAAHLDFFHKAHHSDVLLIFATPNGLPVATAAFYNFDRARTNCEWGRLCRTPEPFAPQTLLEGAYLAHRLAFEVMKVERTYCACSTNNSPAIRMNRTLGYVEEGLRRHHLLAPDGYRDVVEFGMLRDDFIGSQAALQKLLYRDRSTPPEFLPEAGKVALSTDS